MKKLVTVALSLALLSVCALAQDATDGSKKDPDTTKQDSATPADQPSVEQLKEMKKSLDLQQQQIEKLKREAEERDRELQQMQKKVDDELSQAQAQTQPQPETPGVYAASVTQTSSSPAGQMNPATGMPTQPWAVLKISDDINFRFGAVLQPTYEATQDPNSTGYSQNFYLRRARFSILATMPNGVTAFFQTDDPRVGNAAANGAKNINTGFLIQDAYAQWAFLGKAAALQAGLFLVPTIRQVLTSVSTFLALDLPTWSQQEGTVEEANGGRDYGVGFNGAVLDSHLTYRLGAFSGYRAPTGPAQPPPLGPAAGSRNGPRWAGRIMYDVFDTEYAYAYQGTYLGKQHVLAFAVVGDTQGDYKGVGGDGFFQWPVGDVGNVTAEVDYMNFSARPFIYTIGGEPTTLPAQRTIYTNLGFLFFDAHLQPFARYERLDYAPINEVEVNRAKEQQRIGGGLNYYVLGQNFKITPYYERVMPKVQPGTAQIKDFNRFLTQIQTSF